MNIPRHKVFISYYHDEDQEYKNKLCEMTYFDYERQCFQSVFDDYSVRDGDIDDDNMNSETIRKKIRDDYIKHATVLILLCGKDTKHRKYIDWELHAAMFHTENNPRMGIIVINMPEINQCIHASSNDEKNILSNETNWYSINNREEYEKAYPYLPDRIIDNFVANHTITVVDWNRIYNHPDNLMKLIDNAFIRKDNLVYDFSRPLRRKNSC